MIASIMTKGRIDILVMVLSIVLCSHLLENEFGLKNCVAIFVSSLLLMMSSIYVVPLIAIVLLVFLAVNFQNQGRKMWFWKGFSTVAGLLLGFLFTCLFYYKIDFLYHFLSSYFSFNGSINGYSDLLSRIITAYNQDIVSIVLCVLAWSLVLIDKVKDKTIFTLLTIVTLIPAFMTIAGRYAHYYVWMVELGASILLVILLDRSSLKKTFLYALAVITAISLLRPAYWVYKRPAEYRSRMELYSFLEDNKEPLLKYGNVFFRDASCFYKLVEFGVQRYYLQNDNLLVNPSVVEFLGNWWLFENYQEYYPKEFLPEEGVMVTTPKWGVKNGCDELSSNNYLFFELTKDDKFGLFYYKNRIQEDTQ